MSRWSGSSSYTMWPRLLVLSVMPQLSWAFTLAPLRPHQPASAMESSTVLYPIRCYDKYYQLEEMEDQDTCTTELFLKSDGVIEFGDTDGPQYEMAIGSWSVPDGTDDYNMVITRTFSAGVDERDMGEFTFGLTKLYRGDMTKVGESVAVTGVMSTRDTVDETERDVGYFNMIDATVERLGEDKKVP